MGCTIPPRFTLLVVVGLISTRFLTPFEPGPHLIFIFTMNDHKPHPSRKKVHFIGTEVGGTGDEETIEMFSHRREM